VTRGAVLSWSGGKDSVLTLHEIWRGGVFSPSVLLTSVTTEYDRVSIHGVRRSLLERQAAALGIPLFTIELPPKCSNTEYETAFQDALSRVRSSLPHVRHVAFGDLFLEDVRQYREQLIAGSDWEPLFPLWGDNTDALARRFIADGFAARVVCVDTMLLAESFAGRLFDERLLAALPEGVDPCGERGEFHTFVSNGPGFTSGVDYDIGQVVTRDGRFAYCDLLELQGAATRSTGQHSRA
jgi:uncharacterized protein (TIGR00290 family)